MTSLTYHRNGALGVTRVRLSRRRRRVLLALLTGADNLYAWRLCQAAQIWEANLFPFLAHLEDAGWVAREKRTVERREMWCYSLTGQGRIVAAGALRLLY